MRRARLIHGWTFRALEQQCAQAGVKIGFGQLNRIERRLAVPSPKVRAVLARLLDMDIDDFEAHADADEIEIKRVVVRTGANGSKGPVTSEASR